ncbi:MAG TPA: hypothetical protein VFI28_06400 [Candidatus Limnocylindrales bacterium]|nr:hypothetical protein [Candidatus Limnocylindrales bacterium]
MTRGRRWELARRMALPSLFAWVDLVLVGAIFLPSRSLGADGALYSAAATAWLTGADPWDVVERGVRIVAPPPTLVPFVLTSWMPTSVAGFTWVAAGVIFALLAVRALRAPLWWLLFPPLFVAIFHGSIEPLVLALLVIGPGSIAPLLKVYAAIPLIGMRRWRSLALCALFGLVTLVVLPWPQFLSHSSDLVAITESETHGGLSAFGVPLLAVLTLAALGALGPLRASFLVVPALWPLTQFHYAVIALPALIDLPVVAAGASIPLVPYLSALAVIVVAGAEAVTSGLNAGAVTGWSRSLIHRRGRDSAQMAARPERERANG